MHPKTGAAFLSAFLFAAAVPAGEPAPVTPKPAVPAKPPVPKQGPPKPWEKPAEKKENKVPWWVRQPGPNKPPEDLLEVARRKVNQFRGLLREAENLQKDNHPDQADQKRNTARNVKKSLIEMAARIPPNRREEAASIVKPILNEDEWAAFQERLAGGHGPKPAPAEGEFPPPPPPGEVGPPPSPEGDPPPPPPGRADVPSPEAALRMQGHMETLERRVEELQAANERLARELQEMREERREFVEMMQALHELLEGERAAGGTPPPGGAPPPDGPGPEDREAPTNG